MPPKMGSTDQDNKPHKDEKRDEKKAVCRRASRGQGLGSVKVGLVYIILFFSTYKNWLQLWFPLQKVQYPHLSLLKHVQLLLRKIYCFSCVRCCVTLFHLIIFRVFHFILFYLRLIEAYKGSAVLLSCLKAPYAFCLSGQRFCKILKRSERLCETYVNGVTFCHDIHFSIFTLRWLNSTLRWGKIGDSECCTVHSYSRQSIHGDLYLNISQLTVSSTKVTGIVLLFQLFA